MLRYWMPSRFPDLACKERVHPRNFVSFQQDKNAGLLSSTVLRPHLNTELDEMIERQQHLHSKKAKRSILSDSLVIVKPITLLSHRIDLYIKPNGSSYFKGVAWREWPKPAPVSVLEMQRKV
ncbi:hypothetical protein DdX_08271 [Ditylenchus destructor]|uniref:Uncharacterized protein n=1 Tax=Ditylenchus destructor TaxID=166010 RepID=A0AAD4N682_9BILA|nr:hypothetical protein DdX_08271 [Ditylenchus destructor]